MGGLCWVEVPWHREVGAGQSMGDEHPWRPGGLMMWSRYLPRFVPLVLVVLLLPACGDSADDSADTTVAPTTTVIETTTTAPPASTTAPTTATTTTTSSTPVPTSTTSTADSSSSTAPIGEEIVVYVAMGDSMAFSPPSPDGVIYRYAEMLLDEFGVEVDLRNRAVGSLHSTTMLEQLRTNERLRNDLAEADAVTTDIPINVWVESLKTVTGSEGRNPADCGGDDGHQCLRDALEQYKTDTDAIIDEIVAICDPDEVLIRIYDVYMINTIVMLETGTLDAINPYWKAGNDYVEESAARYGIPVAQVYDAFMGPDGTDDPYVKGLLDDDQLHPNAEGAALMADLLDELGY